MGLQTLLWIGLGGFTVVFLTINSSLAFKRIKEEKGKRKCYQNLSSVINDAASIYEDICTRQNVVRGQDNIDLALLISLMEKVNLENMLDIHGIKPESLESAIGFKPKNSEKVCSKILEETFKKRIFEYVQKEFGSVKNTGPEKLFVAMDFNSNTMKELIRNAQHIEDGLPESTYRLNMDTQTTFYSHTYPADDIEKEKQP